MAGFDEVVITRYEGDRHAGVQQKVLNFRVISSADIDVEKHNIEVALRKFLSRHSLVWATPEAR